MQFLDTHAVVPFQSVFHTPCAGLGLQYTSLSHTACTREHWLLLLTEFSGAAGAAKHYSTTPVCCEGSKLAIRYCAFPPVNADPVFTNSRKQCTMYASGRLTPCLPFPSRGRPVSTARQSPLVPVSAGLPFRVVSVGLEGDSVLVPASVRDAGAGRGYDATPRRRRDAISTSTLPFGASSLPTLAPSCRQELQDRCGVGRYRCSCCVARSCFRRVSPLRNSRGWSPQCAQLFAADALCLCSVVRRRSHGYRSVFTDVLEGGYRLGAPAEPARSSKQQGSQTNTASSSHNTRTMTNDRRAEPTAVDYTE